MCGISGRQCISRNSERGTKLGALSQCALWNMDVHCHLIRDVHQQHSWERFSKKILSRQQGYRKGHRKGHRVAVSLECLRTVSKNTICSRARLQITVVCDAMQNLMSDFIDFLLTRSTRVWWGKSVCVHCETGQRCKEASKSC